MGRKNAERVEHPLFENSLWAEEPYRDLKKDAEAASSVPSGRGTTMSNLFVDEQDRVLVRRPLRFAGSGAQASRRGSLALAGGRDVMMVDPVTIR